MFHQKSEVWGKQIKKVKGLWESNSIHGFADNKLLGGLKNGVKCGK